MTRIPVSKAYPARAIHAEHAGQRVCLRRLYVTDAEHVFANIVASLPELRRHMTWCHGEVTLETQLHVRRQTEADFMTGRDLGMALFDDEDQLLCMLGLHPRVPLNPQALEIGYWVPTRVVGRGHATLAVRIASLYAFDKLDCDRLQASYDEVNHASGRVLAKCGFVHEGTLTNLMPSPTKKLIAQGFAGTTRHPLCAIVPEQLEAQAWVEPLRRTLRYENMLGQTVE